ncbi:MAG: chromate resistance protein [Acidobacteriia bacterium]|nr:chromate resistance protein [Terriglobia bacterium]
MKWITRENVKVDRVACPWLIRKFIDSEAEFFFVEEAAVNAQARALQATPFDVPKNPDVKLNHRNGRCSFETILESYQLTSDPALVALGRIVHGADVPKEMDIAPESAGLYALANGFSLTCAGDEERLRLQFPLYDALYAFCQSRIKNSPSSQG